MDGEIAMSSNGCEQVCEGMTKQGSDDEIRLHQSFTSKPQIVRTRIAPSLPQDRYCGGADGNSDTHTLFVLEPAFTQ